METIKLILPNSLRAHSEPFKDAISEEVMRAWSEYGFLTKRQVENYEVEVEFTEESEADVEPEDTIDIPLKIIVRSNAAIDYLGLNPYCINEGGNPNAMYSIPVSKVREFGLI